MRELRKAASGENLILRTGDVKSAIDAMEKWNTEGMAQRQKFNLQCAGTKRPLAIQIELIRSLSVSENA